MTMRIGTGANAQITQYAVVLSTTPKPLETSQPVGTKLPAPLGTLTAQAPSSSSALTLSTGPVNPGRFYVQGVLLVNRDAAITVYVTTDASGVSSVAVPIVPGAALRLDVNHADSVWMFSASGTPTVSVLGV
jgi:hypothetical protein